MSTRDLLPAAIPVSEAKIQREWSGFPTQLRDLNKDCQAMKTKEAAKYRSELGDRVSVQSVLLKGSQRRQGQCRNAGSIAREQNRPAAVTAQEFWQQSGSLAAYSI